MHDLQLQLVFIFCYKVLFSI